MEEVSNAIPEEGSQTPDQDTVPEIVDRFSPTADEISQCPNAVQNLESCNWEQLQEKFVEAMEAHARTEQGLQEQTAQLLGVFYTHLRFHGMTFIDTSARYSWHGLRLQ